MELADLLLKLLLFLHRDQVIQEVIRRPLDIRQKEAKNPAVPEAGQAALEAVVEEWAVQQVAAMMLAQEALMEQTEQKAMEAAAPGRALLLVNLAKAPANCTLAAAVVGADLKDMILGQTGPEELEAAGMVPKVMPS